MLYIRGLWQSLYTWLMTMIELDHDIKNAVVMVRGRAKQSRFKTMEAVLHGDTSIQVLQVPDPFRLLSGALQGGVPHQGSQ